MSNRLINVLIILGVGFVLLPAVSSAQVGVNTSYALSSELGVEITPTYPRPNEMVSVNLTLYTDDLNSANITWYQNGKSVLRGKGETRYSFKTGNVGEETKIEIGVNLLSGASFSKTFTLNPASVDVVWEAISYVPPFYKGKALHPMQGSLKLVAMPEFVKNGRRIPPQNLIYKWSNGINVYQSQSGYGKNVVVVDGSILGKSESIEVLVTDPVNNLVAQGSVNITPTNPEIVFYENNPYYGHIFDESLNGSFNLNAGEVQVLAAPFYFTKEGAGGLKYEWRLNGAAVPELTDSMTAIFRKPEGEIGQSSISLQVTNVSKILQQADNSLIMNFNN